LGFSIFADMEASPRCGIGSEIRTRMGKGATRARDGAGGTTQHVIPAWIAGGITVEPKSKAVPYVWHWRDRLPMAPGDLVLTPNWTWHDHANDTEAPMIWLGGLDTRLVRILEARPTATCAARTTT
jgi:hypothetical protein